MADVAYRRVSSVDQSTARQLEGMIFDKEFEDKVSGGSVNRPALRECLEYLRDGDTLHCHSIDRFARNLLDLKQLVGELTGKGVAIRFHKEGLTFTGESNPMNDLMMNLMGSFAEFERALIRERQREGIAVAKAKGKHLGRAPKLSADQLADVRASIANGTTVIDLAERYSVSRQTIYTAIKNEEVKAVTMVPVPVPVVSTDGELMIKLLDGVKAANIERNRGFYQRALNEKPDTWASWKKISSEELGDNLNSTKLTKEIKKFIALGLVEWSTWAKDPITWKLT
jgi:DNA invertase Pin-like site-specific DNA recombinase